jgi:hypothetical protein
MQALGLGATPDAVNITGNLHAGPARGNQALVTFWRAAEGLAVKPSNGVLQRAVSQADPFHRIKGDVVLHLNNGYASGGWMSDCRIDGKVSSGPQQAVDLAQHRVGELERVQLEHGVCGIQSLSGTHQRRVAFPVFGVDQGPIG